MKFDYNSRIIEQLGAELITSDEMAMSELIKNSYDAFAKNVEVHFINNKPVLPPFDFLTDVPAGVRDVIISSLKSNNLIIVDDDGDGMDYDGLEKGFFTIGSDLKKNIDEARLKKRPVLGNKGLGRLASQRLGHTMFVETTSDTSDEIYLIEIKWGEFVKSNSAEAPEYSFPKEDGNLSYTRIWILTTSSFNRFLDDERPPLFQDANISDIACYISLKEQLLSTINFLYSPFGKKVDDFSINFWLDNIKIESDFNNDAIKLAESVSSFSSVEKGMECKMLLTPWYVERVHMRALGKELFSTWRRTPGEYAALLEKYQSHYDKSLSIMIPYEELSENINGILEQDSPVHIKNIISSLNNIMPIKGEVYSFKRETALFSMAVESAVKNDYILCADDITRKALLSFLDNHNGIKLYRDKYRIANLGDKDSDWLKLQQARTKGQQYFRFELGNIIGHVTINDLKQEYIQETSSRQDIRHTPVAVVFKGLLDYIFNSVFYNLHRNAYYLTIDILDQEGVLTRDATKELKEQISGSDEFIKKLKTQIITFDKKLQLIDKNLDLDTPQKVKQVQKAFRDINESYHSLSDNVDKTVAAISSTNSLFKLIEAKEEAIKVESYNNYKLMANGLITEVLTHELHALVSKSEDRSKLHKHLNVLNDYLIKCNAEDIYLKDFLPLKDSTVVLASRLDEMNTFYHFLEKTFVKKGTSDDFESQNIHEFFIDLENRLGPKLAKVKLDYSSTVGKFVYVPKGVLIHIFYNLIDNSLYWITERRHRAKHDNHFKLDGDDFIVVKYIDSSTMQLYDTGTGVIPKCENTLFYPLESGKRNNEGRGMGLYIIKKLLESFDADITLLPDRNSYGNKYIFEINLMGGDDE